MTLEEKAKAYDEVIKKAESLYKAAEPMSGCNVIIETLFPELKESEDEKVRKELLVFCRTLATGRTSVLANNIDFNKWISWLEKQGDYANFRDKAQVGDRITKNEAGVLVNLSQLKRMAKPSEKQGEKSANEVEPKFHEGQWITNGDYTWKIIEVTPLDYVLQSQDGNIVDDTISHVDDQFHSFTIQDAKDGDVLWHSDTASHGTFIFKQIRYDGKVLCYCDYDSEDHFCTGEHHTCCWSSDKCIKPATKEQRDQLEKAIADAGYTFDFEKKELKKIEQNLTEDSAKVSESSTEEKDMGEYKKGFECGKQRVLKYPEDFGLCKKSAWSKEDNYLLNETIQHLEELIRIDKAKHCSVDVQYYQRDIDWLKSFENRIISQSKQKWSEEDEKKYNDILAILRGGENCYYNTPELFDWLKSLRPQSQWKPSEGDIIILEKLINGELEPKVFQATLQGILEQLKKLKEE